MSTSEKKLSVRERLEAAIALHEFENPASPLTISALSSLAGVSRTNIYSSHPDIAERFRPTKRASTPNDPVDLETRLSQSKEDLLVERKQNMALLFLVTEQREELQRLRVRLALAESKSGRRQTKKAV